MHGMCSCRLLLLPRCTELRVYIGGGSLTHLSYAVAALAGATTNAVLRPVDFLALRQRQLCAGDTNRARSLLLSASMCTALLFGHSGHWAGSRRSLHQLYTDPLVAVQMTHEFQVDAKVLELSSKLPQAILQVGLPELGRQAAASTPSLSCCARIHVSQSGVSECNHGSTSAVAGVGQAAASGNVLAWGSCSCQ